ncbi:MULTISPECIES: N-acetylmuramoyl-L-alanine amidase family protein [Olivibacter]|jgi:N-acetylmuramoyl-L-alanine amidase|uniref:N-acetylmuramoyl-L-alanine amidase n=3 Tax=Sphingobacteriaceae TaxID=84566 RepID=F4CEY6_SPHS2|nr:MULTISPECIES: N-acetylmuramoyl-L-alanine amidase [Olivibacter]MCL4639959.1 N-acetylmuramoyl-L-alanine amidase [Olivibacter sp. UJ_SKK_5.1]MDX3915716.1 N-acetylmuramoyl-L-alanine amidase [Pseudosphingobacterium sp.]QEL01074.1 N-acetylmuramoyl-L-alanine amidase [Olivibacter sp. LS-1]
MITFVTRFAATICLILSLHIPTQSSTNKYDNTYKIKTIVIDAGHGGRDGNTHGSFSKEKDITLAVALKLGKAIEKEIEGVKVVYTRTDDSFIELYERIGIANRNKADLFISLHCNSMPHTSRRVVSRYVRNKRGRRVPVYKTISSQNTSVSGVETFVSGYGRLDEQDVAMRENASMLLEENYQENYDGFDPKDPESYIIFSLMKNQYRDLSIKLATFIQNEYIKAGRLDRGVKEQSLAVLARAGMPAVLTEMGFISNPEEEHYMNSAEGQAEIVENLVNAIKNYKKQIEN